MNGPEQLAADKEQLSGPIFVSYATADRKQALSVCKAMERRGVACWISCRDVAPGENYQDAIVAAIEHARAMVLVFSAAANDSNEIKKELSLASRLDVTVIALRIEDVEPSKGFAYELSTRQWIDAFDGRDKAIDLLVSRVAPIPAEARATVPKTARRGAAASSPRRIVIAPAAALLLLLSAGAWWLLWPAKPAPHSMTVRLAGFKLLSADLPPRMHDSVNSEIAAAFNADGVIGVSTAPAPASGAAPGYALDGTIHRIGETIRVITRLTNERTGGILWSDSIDYPAGEASKIPHKVAVDAATVVRCGLFGASTYRKSLSDSVLGNYMQYCQQYWAYGGSKTLRYAQLVVAAVPDFSWGWSAVANGFLQASQAEPNSTRVEPMRAAGRQAEDKALALDAMNSEALAHKAYLIEPREWVAKEALFKRAIEAKPLDCGCEHYGYGLLLESVGRLGDAIDQFRAATDMLALWSDSQYALADALVSAGRIDEAKPHFVMAADLSRELDFGPRTAVTMGTETGDYKAALAVLRNPRIEITEGLRAPLTAGYEALVSGDASARSKAIRALVAVPKDVQDDRVVTMLAALGANREALQVGSQFPWLFWVRSMRGALAEPTFPAVANQLGLMRYWKTTHTKPDVCSDKSPPPFCAMI